MASTAPSTASPAIARLGMVAEEQTSSVSVHADGAGERGADGAEVGADVSTPSWAITVPIGDPNRVELLQQASKSTSAS